MTASTSHGSPVACRGQTTSRNQDHDAQEARPSSRRNLSRLRAFSPAHQVIIATYLFVAITTVQWWPSIHIQALRVSSSNNNNKPLTVRQQQQQPEARDFKWPQRQVNVLVDHKSLNETERSLLAAVFQQLEHKTCLHVHKLNSQRVNPFMARNLDDSERNFVHIFKSPLGNGASLYGRHPSMGLSSLGCVRQGRQSLVLTDLAFKWPQLVLRYHVMRTLGVDRLERPDGQIRRLLNMLPLNQKIGGGDLDDGRALPKSDEVAGDRSTAFERPALVAFAANPTATTSSIGGISLEGDPKTDSQSKSARTHYLSDSDLAKIKELYECPDYQNRLSPMPLEKEEADAESGALKQPKSAPSEPDQDSQPTEPTSSLTPPATTTLESPSSDTTKKPPPVATEGSSPETSASTNTHDDRPERRSAAEQQKSQPDEEGTKRIIDSLLDAQDGDGGPSSKGGTGDGDKAKSLDGPSSAADSANPTQSNEKIDSHRMECKPLELCPLDTVDQKQQQDLAQPESGQQRPMILKLDDFHAQDPQLKQANQMKLSQLNNDTLETYRLMNNPTNLADFWLPQQSGYQQPQQQQQQQSQQQQQQQQLIQQQQNQAINSNYNNFWQKPKSEMLISFEQSNNQLKDPVSALASSQVLKLCSCTCQTMTPGEQQPSLPPPTPATPPPSEPWPPFTNGPLPTPNPRPTMPPPQTPATNASPAPSVGPVSPTDSGNNSTGDDDDEDDDGNSKTPPPRPSWPPSVTPEQPWPTATELPPATPSPSPPATQPPTQPPTETPRTEQTSAPEPSQEPATKPAPSPTPSEPEQPAPTSSGGGLFGASACDQVEWVRPNKTVYASARIVWDVDRGNENYFLCNNQLNGELIPGKTHGFSCKISQEGKAFEAHSFSVLTKPEHVNLAWVQKNSNSFGRTNFPVIGGYSKQQDPYIVSRCLVKDENNDIITLIGYINNQGVGWFPFDDIQIECSQYDVLACVN